MIMGGWEILAMLVLLVVGAFVAYAIFSLAITNLMASLVVIFVVFLICAGCFAFYWFFIRKQPTHLLEILKARKFKECAQTSTCVTPWMPELRYTGSGFGPGPRVGRVLGYTIDLAVFPTNEKGEVLHLDLNKKDGANYYAYSEEGNTDDKTMVAASKEYFSASNKRLRDCYVMKKACARVTFAVNTRDGLLGGIFPKKELYAVLNYFDGKSNSWIKSYSFQNSYVEVTGTTPKLCGGIFYPEHQTHDVDMTTGLTFMEVQLELLNNFFNRSLDQNIEAMSGDTAHKKSLELNKDAGGGLPTIPRPGGVA